MRRTHAIDNLGTPFLSAGPSLQNPQLTWSSVAGADFYYVYRQIDGEPSPVLIGQTIGTSWVDLGRQTDPFIGPNSRFASYTGDPQCQLLCEI